MNLHAHNGSKEARIRRLEKGPPKWKSRDAKAMENPRVRARISELEHKLDAAMEMITVAEQDMARMRQMIDALDKTAVQFVMAAAHRITFNGERAKQAIYNCICARPEGATHKQIAEVVYGDRTRGKSVISQHLTKMRLVLEREGLTITTPAPNGRYHITVAGNRHRGL